MMETALDQGLPSSIEAERLVLGSVMLGSVDLAALEAAPLCPDDFSLEKHRRIYQRMLDVDHRGERVDRITVYNELKKHNESESCGGLSALISLDDGLPQFPSVDAYIQIIQDKATLRKAIFAAQTLMNRCLLQQGDLRDILADAEAVIARLSEGRQPHGKWLTPYEIIDGHRGGVDAFMSPNRGGSGVPTPWASLNTATCGLQKGDLVLVAGRPSMGKSIIAMQMAHYAAKHGHGAAFFSLEMTKDSLVRRLISALSSVDAQRLRSGALNAEERHRAFRTAEGIRGLPLWIDDTRARTVPAVTAALRKLFVHESVRLVFIDHLQLMKCTGRIESRHHELSEISHSLKHLAGELDVTVVVLSQLNRECEREKRRPQLADLKETGSLEEDADVVLFVHRPEQFDRQDKSLRGVAEFIIGKQRNGPTGKRNMVFLHEFQRFEERTEESGLE